jgi:hypothetical protein
MFAILHAFMLWHQVWTNGLVRIACDNSSVVDALNKHSIKGPAIVVLQRIFLMAAVYDIQILPFWILSGENMVADATSCYDYKRLADLRMQVSRDLPHPATLCQKLHSFFTIPSLQAPDEMMPKLSPNTSPSAIAITTSHILPPSDQSHNGWPTSSPQSNLQLQNRISVPSNCSTPEQVNQLWHSMTNVLTSSLRVEGGSMETVQRPFETQLRPTSSSE